jgi:hypothetical protein
MPLNQVATVHAPDASMLTIQPFDQSMVNEIEKAIRASDLGLNPSNDGKLIGVPIPPLTEERRRQFVKVVHEMAEEHKTATRNVRRDANERLKKALKEKLISEDMEKGARRGAEADRSDHCHGSLMPRSTRKTRSSRSEARQLVGYVDLGTQGVPALPGCLPKNCQRLRAPRKVRPSYQMERIAPPSI